jgi:hypothetical protein
MGSFRLISTKPAILKTPAPVVGGKRAGGYVTAANIQALPLMPAGSDIVQRMALNTPMKLLVTYFEAEEGLLLTEGFVFSMDGNDYPVRGLSPWPYGNKTTYEIVVEDLRNR